MLLLRQVPDDSPGTEVAFVAGTKRADTSWYVRPTTIQKDKQMWLIQLPWFAPLNHRLMADIGSAQPLSEVAAVGH